MKRRVGVIGLTGRQAMLATLAEAAANDGLVQVTIPAETFETEIVVGDKPAPGTVGILPPGRNRGEVVGTWDNADTATDAQETQEGGCVVLVPATWQDAIRQGLKGRLLWALELLTKNTPGASIHVRKLYPAAQVPNGIPDDVLSFGKAAQELVEAGVLVFVDESRLKFKTERSKRRDEKKQKKARRG